MTQQEALQKAKEALDQAISQKKISQEILNNLTPAVIATLQPILNEIAQNTKLNKEELIQALSQIKVNVPDIPKAQVDVNIPEIIVPEPKVTVNVPEIKAPIIPPIKIPEIKVPKPEITVKVPPIKIPDLKWPEGEMDIRGWVQLQGVSVDNPLPVQLRDAKGNPVDLSGLKTQIAGGGGGKADYFTIKGFGQSAFAELLNPDGRVKVEMPAGSSGLTDIELRASSIPVEQVSGSAWSVSVNDIFRTTIASNLINSDDRLRVSLETGGSGLTDAELRASSIPVAQISDGIWSTNVVSIFGSTITALLNGDNRLPVSVETGGSGLTDNELRASSVPVAQISDANWSVAVKEIFGSTITVLLNGDNRIPVSVETGGSGITDAELRASSVPVEQVSGSIWSVYVTGGGGATSVSILNADGTYRDTFPVEGTVAVSGVTNSVAATIIDSTGIGYSGSNPVPVAGNVAVSGVTGSIGATILDGDGLMKATWLVSDITASVKSSLIDSGGVGYSGSNPLPTTIVTGNIASVGAYLLNGDGLFRGTIPVEGTITANLSATDNAVLDTIDAVLDTINAKLVTGTDIGDVTINNASGASAVNIQDGGNTITVDGTVAVSGITASVATSLIDSGGVGYSGSNPVPIGGNVNVNGSLNSVLVTGVTLHDAVDIGDAPIKIGGVAVQDNPTAVAGGDIVRFTADDLGRQLVRPVQARDLIRTAYVTLTSGSAFGTETTLLASGSGAYLDLIYMMGTNNSDVSVDIEFRASTGGTVCQKLTIPSGGTAGVALQVPYPAPFADHTWTIDAPDITGTNVTISALFSKEV